MSFVSVIEINYSFKTALLIALLSSFALSWHDKATTET